MEDANFRILLNVNEASSGAALSVKKGDNKRRVHIYLTEDEHPYPLRGNMIGVLRAKKPDGTILYNYCTIENDAVIYNMTAQTTAAAGRVDCELRLYSAEGEQLTSSRFIILVDSALYPDETVTSMNEATELQRLLADSMVLKDIVEKNWDSKVDKEEGKGLSENDFTDAYKAKLDSVGKSYVLLWSDNTQVDYREENEPVLQELCGLENGKYHVVLRKGNHEYPLLRREYTAAKGYFYYFGGELSESYTAGEYVIGYKPGNSLEAAVYTVTGNSTVNGLELTENDFRPPTTDLVKLCMDEHTGDTDIHVTAAEKAKWNNLSGCIEKGSAATGSVQMGASSACKASGNWSVAMGLQSEAKGGYSFAAGQASVANGNGNIVLGHSLITSGTDQVAVGRNNKEYPGPSGSSDTSGTVFIVGTGTGSARANAFRVTTDGYCRGQNAFSGSGADYAEYFEWADGNPNGEDRRGYFVTLEGRKIRKATGADTYILGVISTTPAMIGNTYSDLWQGMYVTDIFGKRLTETVEVEAATDPDTGEEIPAHTETRFMLNPEYDPAQPYAGRHERPEWAAVGLVGQLVVIDDGTCTVNGYCKITDSGTGTQSEERTAYRVMERLDADHIRIFLR